MGSEFESSESRRRWTEDEARLALFLYFQLAFGQLDQRNPEVRGLASALGRTPSSVAMKLANFASLDPKIVNSGRRGLSGASQLDRRIWAEFTQDWTGQIEKAELVRKRLMDQDGSALREEKLTYNWEPYSGPSVVEATFERRVGQEFFRRAVLANFDNRCCVTGIAEPRLLNASHILPWRYDHGQRHNPENGLALSATFDRAFDRGLITFDKERRLRLAPSLAFHSDEATREHFLPYEGREMSLAARFDPSPGFLEWHRENQFAR